MIRNRLFFDVGGRHLHVDWQRGSPRQTRRLPDLSHKASNLGCARSLVRKLIERYILPSMGASFCFCFPKDEKIILLLCVGDLKIFSFNLP